ncbi:MAG: hydantoinase/oxoprolinase family protein [Alicyclobacillaceae bacterium]|nr:hydantoinase/oxoprolinase family protein [Alicyclobacillaceae bacterium]
MAIHIGIDIGGTFTDLIALDDATGSLVQAKRPSTPKDLVEGIMDCIRRSGLDVSRVVNMVHGSTIAINTVIEQTGARTALVTTCGMRDVYMIGRGNRPEAYNLYFHRPRPLVLRDLTFEVTERLLPSGEEWIPLDEGEVAALVAELGRRRVEAVAICLLHAYANPEHERRLALALRDGLPGCYVTASSEVLREFREYERTSTTVLNAYVGPKVSRYLRNLQSGLRARGFRGTLSIMQSNGGIMSCDRACSQPVNMMESGPVGGIIASVEVGASLGYRNVIAFDMGGTTAKASLIKDGQPTMADMYYIGGYASGHPVMIPVVDVVEVGTGGGSIAWIDGVGALKVGPRSAGADPAPICYGRGGTEPTITDANVVLGRIGTEDFLGGEMRLDAQGAVRGITERIAAPLGMNAYEAAQAIIQIAVFNMSLAVRQVSVEKGYDPRDFAMLACGGAGPLHAVEIARELHIPTVIVPLFPAHFSAIGMLLTDQKFDLVRTYVRPLADIDFAEFGRVHRDMVSQARRVMADEYMNTTDVALHTTLDVRYAGQEFTLPVPVTDEQIALGRVHEIRAAFDAVHRHRFGHHSPEESVEVVNLRVTAVGRRPKPSFAKLNASRFTSPKVVSRPVYLEDARTPVECPVYYRETLPPGFEIHGPALIQEYASTTVLFGQDRCRVAETGELIISVGGN